MYMFMMFMGWIAREFAYIQAAHGHLDTDLVDSTSLKGYIQEATTDMQYLVDSKIYPFIHPHVKVEDTSFFFATDFMKGGWPDQLGVIRDGRMVNPQNGYVDDDGNIYHTYFELVKKTQHDYHVGITFWWQPMLNAWEVEWWTDETPSGQGNTLFYISTEELICYMNGERHIPIIRPLNRKEVFF